MRATVHHDDRILVVRYDSTWLVLDARGGGVPKVAHWGRPLLADCDDVAQLAAVLDAAALPPVPSSTDEPLALSLIPEATQGWQGIPGVEGSRGDRAPATRFEFDGWRTQEESDGVAVSIRTVDPACGLQLSIELEVVDGLARFRTMLVNEGPGPFRPAAVRLALPLPPEAGELLDLTGHALAERRPQRRPLVDELVMRENRRGRTGHDAAELLVAGVPGFGFGSGEVWAVHLAWSGDGQLFAQRLSNGCAILGGGELLRPGEVELAVGEHLVSPWLYALHGHGMDELSAQLHDHLRRVHRIPDRPRPVLLNVWEAVYFDHRNDVLDELAVRAAEVGIERFVLDDGWFRGRRDDTRGLGDWQVDPEVWPEGLRPLADRVHALGMQFGLWFEPEMVNPDSDLAREHPEWILGTPGRPPVLTRHQSVLNLADPQAWDHILAEIDARVTEIGVDYIKWDHNRDLIDAVDSRSLRPVVREQTLAVYRMMDELLRRHPGLEIESCSSGGARVDLGVLSRAIRIWDSDCIDALDRQSIQRWTSLTVPLAMQGTHIGSPISHTTGRRHSLDFRAATAVFGHLGVEWDLTAASDAELAALARWVSFHKEHRDLIHRGRYHRVDIVDPAVLVHGVVASDASEALFAIVLLHSSGVAPLGRIRIPGLRPDARYAVRAVRTESALSAQRQPSWLASGAESSGEALNVLGIAMPAMLPEQAVILHLTQIGPER